MWRYFWWRKNLIVFAKLQVLFSTLEIALLDIFLGQVIWWVINKICPFAFKIDHIGLMWLILAKKKSKYDFGTKLDKFAIMKDPQIDILNMRNIKIIFMICEGRFV